MKHEPTDPKTPAVSADGGEALDPNSEQRTEIDPELQGATLHPGAETRVPAGRPGAEPSHPSKIGPFEIGSVLGWGGMGAVYLADQHEPMRRRVAVKIVHSSLRTPKALARFDAERQALARLTHPNVAQLYEAGTTDDGFPFFAMEYVPGIALTDYCNCERLDLDERLALFVDVCLGVQHAHQKGIIHRDIKPANILVTETEGVPEPKVIDFGIAKAVDRPLIDQEELTTGMGAIGTPSYMSPEALIAGADVDTRSDVYALGIVLYELLTGLRPHAKPAHPPASLSSLAAERTPVKRPSQELSEADEETAGAIAINRRITLQELVLRIRGDLDWIVMKAIAIDPDERYPSAAALAADIRRHLAFEPITARPPSLWYRLRKFQHRHRFGVAAAATLLLALVLGGIGTSIGFLKARDAERKARQAEQEALAQAARADDEARAAGEVSSFLTSLFELSDPHASEADSVTARELLERGAERIGRELDGQPVIRGRFLLTMGVVYRKLGLFEQAGALLEEALQLHEGHLPSDSLELAHTLSEVGDTYRELARYDDAEALLERSLAILTESPGDDVELYADLLHRLGGIHQGRGRFEEAEEAYREALQIRERTLADDDRRIADTLNNLGFLYSEQGLFEKAAASHDRALAIRRAYGGPDHPDVADSLSNLAIVYARQGDIATAEPLFAEALAVRERALPPDHPDLAISLNNVGLIDMENGRYDESEAKLRRVLEIRRKVLGDSHPLVASPLSGLGHVAKLRGDYETAVGFFLDSLEIKEKTLTPGHVRIGTELASLGEVYRRMGRERDAEGTLDRALAILEPSVAPDHLGIAEVHHSLGLLRLDRERYGEAESHLELAHSIVASSRAADDEIRSTITSDYARLLRAIGRVDEADELESPDPV